MSGEFGISGQGVAWRARGLHHPLPVGAQVRVPGGEVGTIASEMMSDHPLLNSYNVKVHGRTLNFVSWELEPVH